MSTGAPLSPPDSEDRPSAAAVAAAVAAAPEDSLLGRVILGRYRVEKAVGRGAIGRVYRAHDGSLKEPCAVKVVPPEVQARFDRERVAAQRMRKIRGVPAVRDCDELPDGRLFLVFDYCDGKTLAAWLAAAGGRQRILAVLDWAIAAAETMQAVHEAGVIHRDLSARNLIVDDEGSVWVVDFGLAHVADQPRLTSPGMILGTWPYTAPEQLQSPDNVDGRADIYSLAMVMYRSLAGREAMPQLAEAGDRDVAAMVQAAKRKAPLGELVPELPSRVVRAIMRGADPSASRRFATMREFAAELRACRDEIQKGAPARPRRRWWWWMGGAIAIVTVAAAILVGMLWMRGRTTLRIEGPAAPLGSPAPVPEPDISPPMPRATPAPLAPPPKTVTKPPIKGHRPLHDRPRSVTSDVATANPYEEP